MFYKIFLIINNLNIIELFLILLINIKYQSINLKRNIHSKVILYSRNNRLQKFKEK